MRFFLGKVGRASARLSFTLTSPRQRGGLKPALLPCIVRHTATIAVFLVAPFCFAAPLTEQLPAFIEKHCANCHNDVDKEAGLDLTSLNYTPDDPGNFLRWVKVFDRLEAGEMPPKEKKRPDATELATLLKGLSTSLAAKDRENSAREGRATQRRLNGYEYENALRDLLTAPWLQIKGQFPDDGEAHRFNKVGDALDVSHVHMSRYMSAADYAMRQVLSVKFEQPPTSTKRYYARNQRTLTSKFTGSIFNSSPDRMTFPVLGITPQPDVRWLRAPLSVGETNPEVREREAIGWVSSNYVTGFTYRWDEFRAPVAGRYRVRFSGYTLWVAPGGIQMRFSGENDKVGTPRPPNFNVGNYDSISEGRRDESITVYTRNGVMNRRVGEFDLTPEPAVRDIGEVWLLANETLVPDASRFYRSRPNNFRNPLMTPEGTPGVAFRWMEIEGPLYDESTTAGYRLLFGDLPLRKMENPAEGGVTIPVIARGDRREGGRNAGQRIVPLEEIAIEVVSRNPKADAKRLLRNFVQKAYRRPVADADVQRFVALFEERMEAGLSFTESMLASYTAVLASPGFVFLEEKPGRLDDYALATRLALFLANSVPDAALRSRADRGELQRSDILRSETDRLLAGPHADRFVEGFLDYWIDLRKMEDSTPSTTLYNDYYLDDALMEAATAETRLFFTELLQRNLSARHLVNSDFTFVNERLATHYGIPGVQGVAMRRFTLPPDSPRGGFMTQASVLKITANGTTTSPVLRGKWIMERILGIDIPPPPPVAAVEPDIRGAVTIRQQLEKHRDNASCASCHSKMDPPGFALESFDVMGGWRDQYRAITEGKPAVKGLGKNGQPFEFHYGLPVDTAGALPDGRKFADIREFKKLMLDRDEQLARNLVKQLLVYATGAPVRFSDRAEIEKIVASTKSSDYGVRSLIHALVQSELFVSK
jgi:hypothetical protein